MSIYQEFYTKSQENPEAFWAEQAEAISWFKKPTQIVSQSKPGFYHWFEDGELNSCYLAIDQHIEQGNGDRKALIYDSPVTSTKLTFTYNELYHHVARLAGAMSQAGIEKGDRVVIYMPMVPEAVFAMLAC